ncbi:MAG: DMT family transporter [Planctomycetaceae bacterium]|nr:DMT family transporter [Planctomycetaceae bacterium]
MNPSLVVGMMIVSGALMAFQGPINAALRTHVGVFESALISFLVGTTVLIGIVLARGEGSLLAARQASWWQLCGGLIGAVFVTVSLLAAPKIGVTGMIVAALAGQLAAGALIDRFGWVQIPAKPVDLPRVAGLALLVVSVILINWSSWKKA